MAGVPGPDGAPGPEGSDEPDAPGKAAGAEKAGGPDGAEKAAGPEKADDAGWSAARPLLAPPRKPPRPSSALPISLGTIQTLLASPWAICGSICMYW